LEVLKHCPQLQVLVRPFHQQFEQPRFEFSADCLPLTSVKRIEWWHYNNAARSGGINALEQVLLCAPNVEYLVLGGELWGYSMSSVHQHLAALSTLRIGKANALFIHHVCKWVVPHLQHVIADAPIKHAAHGLRMVWEMFGQQLRTVELGRSLAFILDDHITDVLVGCPNLERICYYVHFTSSASFGKSSMHKHPQLRAIGLHGAFNPIYAFDSPQYWELLEGHLTMIANVHAMPSLKRVVLHGENWSEIMRCSQFEAWMSLMKNRGCRLETSDGRLASPC
jgi:hypothetical protein